MSERPNTSGGPGSRSTVKIDFKFDKRMSRDDSFINVKSGGMAGSKPFAPMAEQLPTPEASPRSTAVPRTALAAVVRMDTPESFKSGGSEEIGMALGSPSHPPTTWGTWNPQSSFRPRQATVPDLRSTGSASSSVDATTASSKKQPGKWKLFGMFGRKHSEQSIPTVSISEPNDPQQSNRPEQIATIGSESQPGERTPERSNTMSARKPWASRHKPIVVRSQTMPTIDRQAQISRPKGKVKDGNDTSGSIPVASDISPKPGGSMLDVEIPSVTMERYSVMFGSVLQSQPSTSTSLLARRQATVQRLKSIEDAIEREEEDKYRGIPRRATSPQPSNSSPSFALFPQPPSLHLRPPHRLSPRMRSNTSPALLPSPSKVTFDDSARRSQQPSIQQEPAPAPTLAPPPAFNHLKHHPSHGGAKNRLTIATLAKTRESQQPQLQQSVQRTTQFTENTSNLILESPTEIESPVDPDSPTAPRMAALRPDARHVQPSPKWQMVTSPSQLSVATMASNSAASTKSRAPSSATHTARPSTATSGSQVADDGTASKMKAVELSIARQISISRQQSKMLQPLRTTMSSTTPTVDSPAAAAGLAQPQPQAQQGGGGGPRRGSAAKTSPIAGMAMGRNERIAETKTSTPTLVHPAALGANPFDASQYQHMHNHQRLRKRKSERVILDHT